MSNGIDPFQIVSCKLMLCCWVVISMGSLEAPAIPCGNAWLAFGLYRLPSSYTIQTHCNVSFLQSRRHHRELCCISTAKASARPINAAHDLVSISSILCTCSSYIVVLLSVIFRHVECD